MPIGGGTFTGQNKILPGAYINVVGTGAAAATGTNGIVALALELDWGPESVAFSVDATTFIRDSLRTFGVEASSPGLLLVREALKRARTLLCYRVNGGGTPATATISSIQATAKYSGVLGNQLRVAISTNIDDEDMVDVITYLGTSVVDKQTVNASTGASSLAINDFVTFSGNGTGALIPTAAMTLSGGTNGMVTAASHAAAIAAFEVERFNAIGYCGNDEDIKALYAAFVRRLRYDDGRKVIGILYRFSGDDIGLINVLNGVILADGTVLSGEKAVAWVAAATASARINESLTNVVYDGAVDVDVKLTKSQYEAAIQSGQFVFYNDFGTARVLLDVNSLTSFSDELPESWASNRLVRVMDGWANAIASIFSNSYIGQITNNETGRQLFRADIVKLARDYQRLEAIGTFEPSDVSISEGDTPRAVSVTCVIRPFDSMDKLYMTVLVK